MGHFKPFKTTKSDVHNPEKQILRKIHNNWKITAASPLPIHPPKLLNLDESLKLLKEQNEHLKVIEAQYAVKKLQTFLNITMVKLSVDTSHYGKYREKENDDKSVTSDSDESDGSVTSYPECDDESVSLCPIESGYKSVSSDCEESDDESVNSDLEWSVYPVHDEGWE